MEGAKKQLYAACEEYVEKRLSTAREAMEAARRGAENETKSSSGDKYETGRAMMQLEMEKHALQLQEALKVRNMLDQVVLDARSDVVRPGSLVITQGERFFIAISAGKIIINDVPYLVIAPTSPLGQSLMGCKIGDHVSFRDQNYVIQEIL